MDLFGKKAIKQLKDELLEVKQFAFTQTQNIAFQNIKANFNSNLAIYPNDDLVNQTSRYSTTGDIYSIVKRLSTIAASIPMYAYLVNDEPAAKALLSVHTLQKNLYKNRQLQKKAFEDLPEDDLVQELLNAPSDQLSKYEFFESIYSFLFLLGESFIKKERPNDGVNNGLVRSLMILHPKYMIPKVTSSLPRRIVSWDYKIGGEIIYEDIPVEDIIHIKYFNPNFDRQGTELRGQSPLVALAKNITRSDSSMDTSVSQLQNGGVKTIISDKGPATQRLIGTNQEVSVAGYRKNDFYTFAGDSRNTGSPYWTNGDLEAIQLGLSLADLSVLELGKIDFKKLCNAWSISDVLFNNDAASTESNVLTMTKMMYTNAIIPNVNRVKDALSKGLLDEFANGVLLEEEGQPRRIEGDGIKRVIDIDTSNISELHEDLGKKVEQFANMPIMIPNMILEELGYPTVEDDPSMNKVYIKSGYAPIDDFNPEDPLEQNPTPKL